MKRPVRITLIVGLIVLAGLLIAAGTHWFQRNYHRVEQTLYLPPTGEAAYNPLYALRRALEADGVKAQSRQRLALDAHPPGPRDTVLLFNEASGLDGDQTRRLLDWVEQGGHLLVRTPPRRIWDGSPDPLLFNALGVETREQSQCADLQVEGQRPHVEFCRGRRFRLHDVEPELAWGDLKAGYVYARLAHGEGHVDVLADFDFLVNQGEPGNPFADPLKRPQGGLRDVPHQALARQVLAPNYGAGTMHLVYAADMPSLLRTILFRGWMVWGPLLVALLAWLWSRMRPFGPPLPAPSMDRRSLLEHVRASGDHLFRYGRGVLLYTAARQAFLARLRRRDPMAAALAGEAQVEAVAERLGVPADTVRTALQTPSTHDKTGFRDRISTLIQLRNRL
ncbi:MAG TPA: DUF4350 domain-containing protein [Pseudoxanthomonas sp.]